MTPSNLPEGITILSPPYREESGVGLFPYDGRGVQKAFAIYFPSLERRGKGWLIKGGVYSK